MHNICIDAESFVALLNHCPSLVKLELVHPSLTLDSSAIQRLTPMNNLRSLLFMAILDNELSLLTALERFPVLETLNVCATCLTVAIPSHCKPLTQLKHLKLERITWKCGYEVDTDGSVGSFLEHLIKGSSLERISIRVEGELSLGYKAVRAFAMIPTLKALSLHVNVILQDDEFVEFIRALGGTAVEVLDFSNTNDLSFAVLDALAMLPLLNRFVSSVGMSSGPKRFQRVNMNGLRHMLCTSPNLKDVCFDAMVPEDSGVSLTRGQIEELMEQKIPRYHGSRAGYWEVRDLTI
ncbi:hypothetical protein BJV82DRAFT_111028 [Fennellomyces sp. T-0311]|nr:hypothetical protein BJV82DRAFT_111028 [Fennellomyces sp. T-0311]